MNNKSHHSEITETRKKITSDLRKMLKKFNLQLKYCGSKKESLENCPAVNEDTGFWQDPNVATNKPLRWFIHFGLDEDQCIATIPNQHGSRRLAFANTAQGTSGALATRIIPVIKLNDSKYVFHEPWEWMLLHCFMPPLPVGSSGQLFDDFDEKTGKLTYMGQNQSYVAAALITLNDEDSVYSHPQLDRPLVYSEATIALQNLIHIFPTESKSSPHEEKRDG